MATSESMAQDYPAELSAALLSVHVHGLLASEPAWARARPADVPLEQQITPLPDAVQTLLRYGDGSRAFGGAFVAWAQHRARARLRLTDAVSADNIKLLADAYSALHFDVDRVPGPFNTAEEEYLWSLRTLGGIGACVKAFSWESVYDLNLESTAVTVSVYVDRPVADFTKLVDPQDWTLVAQQTFLKAYRTLDANSPANPFDNPSVGPSAPGTTWHNKFFEHAQWAISGAAFSNFRNMLEIDYAPESPTGASLRTSMKYELYENLTQEVLGFKDFGGIDIDSGTVTIEPDTSGVALTKMVALKKLRFTAPVGLKTYLNWLNLPLLTMWMLGSIVGSACAPSP
jgi:hypothetical protein